MGAVSSRGTSKFRVIVDYAKRKIEEGVWSPDSRVPSENELAKDFGVSRMTARRALDQLALGGLVVRRRGSGSFVATNGVLSSFLVIRNVAEEIRESGRSYSSTVRRHCAVRASRRVANTLCVNVGARVFHSLILHQADTVPVQLEYRFVRPEVAPLYLEADLSLETPNHYLQRVCPLVRAVQDISAGLPSESERRALNIEPREACLVISRVTWCREGIASFVRTLCPASRYKLSGQLYFNNTLKFED